MKREITLKIILFRYILLFFAVLFAAFVALGHCQVSPILGNVGNIQVFDNFGSLCPQCVLYSYQAGTTTQQATFTDATGTVQNPNPITFTSGARAAVWLTTGAFYKLVLCAQNDGAFCAPSDVLFSSDQVPGGASGSGGGGGSPFISGSANPASTGILRLASGDSVCWRNAANSANLCIAKDTADVLNWAGGAIKFPQIACANTLIGFDYLCASSTNNRWLMANNGGGQVQIVGAGVDINTSDQVTQVHFGSTAIPFSGTAPTTNQFLQWNGTNVIGSGPVYTTVSASTTAAISATTMATAGGSGNLYRFSWYLTQTAIGASCTTASTVQPQLIYTDPNSGGATTFSFGGAIFLGGNNGTVGPLLNTPPNGSNAYTFRAKSGTAIQYATGYAVGTGCSPAPAYQIYPLLEQITVN